MSSYQFLLLNNTDGVLTITLNRPDSLNSFNDEMSFELQKALKEAERDKSVRCVVLTGAGRAFSAGQDLKSRSIQSENGATPHLGESIEKRYAPIISKLRNMEKPVVASVNGVAAGAGASIAFACDMRLASEKAIFLQAFGKVGLVPDSGACWLLPRLCGLGKAMELAMTGDKISAEEALTLGLVNHVFSEDLLAEKTSELATQLAKGPTKAMGLIKRAFNRAMTMDLDTYLAYEAQTQEIAGRTADYKEGVAAFMEKREAQFTGK